MKILCIGDVVGQIGCSFLRSRLPALKKAHSIDAVIVNGENSAEGNGISPLSAEDIFSSGVDVITTGNHVFRQRSVFDTLDENEFIIRPANYPDSAPGKGYCLLDFVHTKVAVINLLGTVYLEALSSPFDTADRFIEKAKADGAKIIIIDMHAEATAEKKALAYYLDGKVSAVFGTHTHVQTADAQILPEGTGFITDLGMTGPINSVLGVKPELSVAKMKDKLPVKFLNAEGDCVLEGCIFEIDRQSGKTLSTKSIRIF